MSSPRRLEIGANVHYDGSVYRVEGLEGHATRLLSSSGGRLVLSTSALVQAPDFEVLEDCESVVKSGTIFLGTETFDLFPEHAIKEAETLAGHLDEAVNGSRNEGLESTDGGVTLAMYDPELTTLTQRMLSKAGELNLGKSTLWRLKRKYDDHGLYGLLNKKHIRRHTALERLDPLLRNALVEALDEVTESSNVSARRILRRTEKKLEGLDESVDMPSRATLYRILKELMSGLGTMGPAKARRSIANGPKKTYRRFKATRPGEIVHIDSTPLDILVLDPATLKWTSAELTLALDLNTRSILASRITPKGAGGIDAALLLADIIYPMRMRERWSEDARWSYCGIPEEMVVAIFEEPDPAKRPIVRPETVLVDHGRIYESKTFLSACHVLGITVQSARPYTPTDKAQVERVFRTIRQSLLENLPAYKGPDIASRGLDVESKAFYFIEEVEEILTEWVVRYYQNRPHKGLHLPGVPNRHVSPNEMYEFGLTTSGFLYVPPDADLYYQLLDSHDRKIGHDGFTLGGLRYDGEALAPYRNRSSTRGGRNAKKYAFRLDPRDRSKVYFQDPQDGEWHEIPWVDAPSNVRPFSDKLLSHAKGLLLSEQFLTGSKSRDLSEVLEEIFERVDRDQIVDPKERKVIAKGFMRSLAAQGERRPDAPGNGYGDTGSDANSHDDDGYGSPADPHDPWDIDFDSIEAYPLFGSESRSRNDGRGD